MWQVRLAGALLDSARIGSFLSLACLRNGMAPRRTALLAGGAVLLWTGAMDLSYRMLRRGGAQGHVHSHGHHHHHDNEAQDHDGLSIQEQALASAVSNPAAHLVGGVVSALLMGALVLPQNDAQTLPPLIIGYAMLLTLIVQIWRLRLPAFARGGSSFWYPLLGTGLVLTGGVLLGMLFQKG